ncbi:MAG: hypothetical protein J7M25_04850 [Deltaproteobacteria bacterium]|nr:hypothetical protein [Deltaproteobacteria bacterium]
MNEVREQGWPWARRAGVGLWWSRLFISGLVGATVLTFVLLGPCLFGLDLVRATPTGAPGAGRASRRAAQVGKTMAGGQAPLAMMAGRALPDTALPSGSIVVRVVQDRMTAGLAGVVVELRTADGPGPGTVLASATSDSKGRVTLDGASLKGRMVRIAAWFHGAARTSQLFRVPAAGGVRFLLAFGVPVSDEPRSNGSSLSGPGGPGAGPQPSSTQRPVGPRQPPSAQQPGGRQQAVGAQQPGAARRPIGLWVEYRVRALEAGRMTLTVTYVLDRPKSADWKGLVLPGPRGFVPVMTDGLPRFAASTKAGVVLTAQPPTGRQVLSLSGTMAYSGDILLIEHRIPVPYRGFAMVMRRYGGVRLVGADLEEAQMGASSLLVTTGPGGKAGGVIRFAVTGLPHRDRTWAWIAVGFALALLGYGLVRRFVPVRRPVQKKEPNGPVDGEDGWDRNQTDHDSAQDEDRWDGNQA